MSGPTQDLLVARGIGKEFPGVRALHRVDLSLRRGEVLAVIGENGAGKSTLMKILAGIQQPDAGSIELNGQRVVIDSVRSAEKLGISLIHQELNLADNLDVGANIFLGREFRTWGLIDHQRIRERSKEILQKLGLDISPDARVSDLSLGRQQMVEIAKALSTRARILIMDEPTSSLSQQESESLFRVVRDLRRDGVSVIYISHRLGEVRELADRVVVLRDGENAGELNRDEIDHDAMVRLMVGREVSQYFVREQHELGTPLLEVENLVVPAHPAHRVSFQLRQGELVGMAGLVGAGRTELLEVLFGLTPARSGRIRVAGKTTHLGSSLDAIRAGIALVPEDRKRQGVVLEMSVRHNIGLAGLRRHRHPGGMLNHGAEAADSRDMISRLRIKTPGEDQVVRYLSGGNQQKVVLGKWLALEPRILLLDEPTRGIDVGAKQEIYQLMEALAQRGVAVLFVSSDMEEVLGMSDRVLVMHEGRLAGELPREDLSEEAIMHLATGKGQAA